MSEAWRKSSYSGGGNGNCVEMTWRKSSHSGGTGNGDCVEVAMGVEAIGVRDSKNVSGPTLEFNVDQWRAFLATAR